MKNPTRHTGGGGSEFEWPLIQKEDIFRFYERSPSPMLESGFRSGILLVRSLVQL